MIPTRARQDFFDSLFEGEEGKLTAMTKLEWVERETVDYCFWHLSEGRAVKDLARELAVSATTIYRWRSRAGERDLWPDA